MVPGTVPEHVGIGHGAAFLRGLRQNAGEFVVDARFVGGRHCAIISVKKTLDQHEGMQMDVALAAFSFGITCVDNIILVDEDIDINNFEQIFWAIVTRCDPKEQVHIINGTRGHENNPIAGVKEEFGLPVTRSKMIIDATIPFPYKKMTKGDNISYFSLSKWKDIDLGQYASNEAIEKWFEC
jgi:UbiD family decarboxylase